MITVTKQENGVLFTFTNSDKYLYGSGTIEVPFNSLSIIQDESDNITLRKSASNDIFLSARYDTDFGYASKEAAVEALKEILYDEAGISEEEVQEMIDAATSGMPSSEVVEQLRTDVNTLSGTVSSHTADTNVHFTGTQKSNYDDLEVLYHAEGNWNIMPQTAFEDFANDYSVAMGQFDQRITANASAVTAVSNDLNTLSGEVDTKVDTTTYESGQYATAQALNALQENKLDASAYTPTDLSEYWTSGQTQEAINAATSGIPSSQVVEQLRTDINTVSGDVETKVATSDFNAYSAATATALGNKQDALVFYSESPYDEEAGTEATAQIQVSSPEYPDYAEINVQPYTVALSASYEGEDPMSTTLIVQADGVTINDENVATEPYVDAAISGKADTSAVTQVNNALTAHTANTTVHVSQAEKDAWNAKADASAITSIESSITTVSNDLNTLSGAVIDNEYTVSQAINSLNTRVTAVESGGTGGGITSGEVQTMIDDSLDIYWTSAQTQTAIDGAKAYYIDFGALTTQGIHDADWDGMVAAINAHRPIYAGLPGANGLLYYTAECLYQDGSNIIKMTASDHNSHYFYTFTKNGSENYDFGYVTRPYVTDAEKNTWNAKQDALSAGTGIEISGNVISVTGGGGSSTDTYVSGGTVGSNGVITLTKNDGTTASVTGLNTYVGNQIDIAKTATGGYDDSYVNVSGDTMTGALNIQTANITGAAIALKDNNTDILTIGRETGSSAAIITIPNGGITNGTDSAVWGNGVNRVLKITQAQYDALATKDSFTLYIVVD